MDAISVTLLICKNKMKNLPRNQYLRDSDLWNKRSDLYLTRWPNGLAKQKQNLRTDLRLVAKRIRKSHCKFPQAAKSRKLHPHTVYLRSTCVGWPNGEKLACEFELEQSRRKSTHMGGQTKHGWILSTCVDLRVRLARALTSSAQTMLSRTCSIVVSTIPVGNPAATSISSTSWCLSPACNVEKASP